MSCAAFAQLVVHLVGGDDEEPTGGDTVDDELAGSVGVDDAEVGTSRRSGLSVERDLLHDVRHHTGRAETRHADATRPQVDGQRLRQPDDGVLGGRVREPVVAVREQPCRGRGVDDVAGALLEQPGQEHREAAHHAHQVDVDDPLPNLRAGCPRPARRRARRRCSSPGRHVRTGRAPRHAPPRGRRRSSHRSGRRRLRLRCRRQPCCARSSSRSVTTTFAPRLASA